jgi:hypothetical protein
MAILDPLVTTAAGRCLHQTPYRSRTAPRSRKRSSVPPRDPRSGYFCSMSAFCALPTTLPTAAQVPTEVHETQSSALGATGVAVA